MWAMAIRNVILPFVLLIFCATQAFSQCNTTTPTYKTINSAGTWTTNSDWVGGSSPYTLSAGAYTIPSGDILEVNSSNFTLNDNLIVNGILFVSGKLVMAAGKTITVNSGGRVTCCSSGYCGGSCSTCDNSDKISIGGTNAWSGAGGGGAPSSGPFTGPATVTPGGVTPVKLLFFKAKETDEKQVQLAWATAEERNFDYFSVERSQDGLEFAEVGTVKGHGTSLIRHDYSFTDYSPLFGRSYYRLTSIDFDLYSETFNVISVNTRAGKSLSVYPNPVVNGKLNLDLNFPADADLNAFVTDLTGTQIAKFKINSTTNTLSLDLKPGSYLLKVSSADFSSVSRFVVH
jgi:hypothetical protein